MFKSLRLLWYKKGIRNLTIENVLGLCTVKLTLKSEIFKSFPLGRKHLYFFFWPYSIIIMQ